MSNNNIIGERIKELKMDFVAMQEGEPMSDLISRQEVLNKLNKLDQQELYLPCHFKEFVIDEVPSVPQKTGRWIPIKPLLTAARCSECKSAFAERTNYCPRCGARMEGN